jgi:hypothetical protein
MKAKLARAMIVLGLPAAATVIPGQLSAAVFSDRVHDVVFEVEPSPGAQATYATCAQVVELLAERGWAAGPVRVRIQENRFDATASAADVVLGAEEASEDSSFLLASALVERQLRRNADPLTASMLAQSVAAHVSAPSSARRLRWELAWLDRLARGDVLTTALPELLWRSGADAAIRRGAQGNWPASAFAVLSALGVENPLHEVGELAVAGLVDPQALGFHQPPVPEFAPAITQSKTDVSLVEPGVRIVSLASDTGAAAVLPLQSERTEAWVAVRYALTGAFDVVPLNQRAEVTVPLQGVAWAGAVVVATEPDAHLSLAVRAVSDYPVQIKRWDFLAGDRQVTLSWETLRQEGLRAFVVEALEKTGPGSWKAVRRTILPVADDGETSFGYAFVDEESEDVAAYRLLALTSDGFLADLGSFPLRQGP